MFDTFLSSYGHALSALLFKLQKEPVNAADVETFSKAKRLADEALKDLRMANDRRNRPEEAEYIAEIGLAKLKERCYHHIPLFRQSCNY